MSFARTFDLGKLYPIGVEQESKNVFSQDNTHTQRMNLLRVPGVYNTQPVEGDLARRPMAIAKENDTSSKCRICNSAGRRSSRDRQRDLHKDA